MYMIIILNLIHSWIEQMYVTLTLQKPKIQVDSKILRLLMFAFKKVVVAINASIIIWSVNIIMKN